MALKPKQIELIECILANPMATDKALAEILKLNNKTVGVYKKNPEFQEELKRRLAEQWKSAELIAQKRMIELADGGCFQANKYILDSLGYAPAQKIEADVKTNIVIDIEE